MAAATAGYRVGTTSAGRPVQPARLGLLDDKHRLTGIIAVDGYAITRPDVALEESAAGPLLGVFKVGHRADLAAGAVSVDNP